MRLAITLATALLALGACGGGTDKGDGNAADSRQAAADKGGNGSSGGGLAARPDVRLRPGRWEMKTSVAAINAPGMPKGVADMMKSQDTTVTTCISEEEANRSDSNIFTGKKDANCSSEGFQAKAGRLSGTVTCKGENGQGTMTMTMDGAFAPERYDVQTRMKMDGVGGGMVVESKTSGRRIGECAPGTDS